jgi:hypothetical protein
MARLGTAVVIATLAIASIAGPVGAREFGGLYAEGNVYRTFGNPARVDPGTGQDPIYTFENSTNPDQLSVARYAPGDGSHGGRWAVHHATWTSAADASILVTDYETLAAFAAQGRLLIVRDEAADFRCPILPNG